MQGIELLNQLLVWQLSGATDRPSSTVEDGTGLHGDDSDVPQGAFPNMCWTRHPVPSEGSSRWGICPSRPQVGPFCWGWGWQGYWSSQWKNMLRLRHWATQPPCEGAAGDAVQPTETSRVFPETLQGKSPNPNSQGRRDGCTSLSKVWRLLRWEGLETCDFQEEEGSLSICRGTLIEYIGSW